MKNTDAGVTRESFNAELARLMKGLKKDIGAGNVRQGYKGTGSNSYRRQIFVRMPDMVSLPDGVTGKAVCRDGKCVDVWLNNTDVMVGGVMGSRYDIRHADHGGDADKIYEEICKVLRIRLAP